MGVSSQSLSLLLHYDGPGVKIPGPTSLPEEEKTEGSAPSTVIDPTPASHVGRTRLGQDWGVRGLCLWRSCRHTEPTEDLTFSSLVLRSGPRWRLGLSTHCT